ncbi:maleylpyruvate isomerase family mycothiol-dependent enzyme [Nocardia sp. CDC159]|uniref:Maleylpyruvate isomerase family mycothiol-dependent enzyme n=1 Tax=Nocardia pulmonis TaxID=2951408 RepID=A0A9X2EGV6_9NOCA|nr:MULTISPECIES: maleylpyruvate isomerase family mycothiol-dependent enzyme [Nocardia]MCM6778518.1 maleylpyruvate isomerase family mycothiol-dependent enzyme [Nocardia pulmonis]MCM6791407.1 maleylpyruvate isomerase family mycothiol-dependent enzyme [Nocardia sp. CDC159]
MTSATPEPLLDTVDRATQHLLDALGELTDADVPEPSLLPGWTRGHVLAHLARNADGLLNLLLWARTGIETPQYASQFLRDSDIETGAPRPIAEQLTDLRAASDRWLALARAMPADRWDYRVRARTGKQLPASAVPWLRLREIEIHHVDLNIGYRPQDWPADFVARMLTERVEGLDHAAASSRPADAKPMTSDPSQPPPPSFVIETTDTGFGATIGPAPTTKVSGPAAEVLAWLIGRSDGGGLSGELPTLPAWL